MGKVFLDTSALVELASGSEKGKKTLRLVKESNEVFAGALNLYELWYIRARSATEREAEKTVLTVKTLSKVIPADEEICILAAKLKKAHAGKKISAVDFVTAASAILIGATVVTGDSDFLQITEAKVNRV